MKINPIFQMHAMDRIVNDLSMYVSCKKNLDLVMFNQNIIL